MAEAAATETPLPLRAKRGPAEAAAGQAHRRLRLLVVLACALLALALLAHGWNMLGQARRPRPLGDVRRFHARALGARTGGGKRLAPRAHGRRVVRRLQPVVDLATRAPVDVEALVRWRHPGRGLAPPVEFVGIAEECGLIDAVGSFVLRAACLQFVRWRGELGALAPRHLAVNLSRAQLKRGDLVHEVRDMLREAAMCPEQLHLEITESLAAQDQQVQTTLRELKALGVKLALDDFGTGHSSPACLHQLPVGMVKVDRSFVRHAARVEYHRVLIEATIRVSRALGMTTESEGIETAGQAALMLPLDCDRGQGFLCARPLEADDYPTWVRQERVAMPA